MSSQPVVADSSPLIAVTQIHHIDLLPTLFGTVVIPPAVQHETRTSVPRPDWLIERALTKTVDPRVPSSLHAGEREAISLALELDAVYVILDDLDARRAAAALGLPVIGTLGILLMAKEQDRLAIIRPELDALRRVGFFISPDLYRQVLISAGELR